MIPFISELGASLDLEDRGLFQEIYRQELSAVRNFLRRLGAPSLHADDLVHDVFVIAYQRFQSYDRARSARPWLLAIALRRYWTFNQRAAIRREIKQDVVSHVDDATASPDEALANSEKRALLMRALETLDLDRRAVFVMHEVEGCTAPEIAEALEVPLNTVYSRLRRAREHLERTLRALCETEGLL